MLEVTSCSCSANIQHMPEMDKAMEDRDGLGFAIEVKNAIKGYGSLEVLKGLNMNVPYGSM